MCTINNELACLATIHHTGEIGAPIGLTQLNATSSTVTIGFQVSCNVANGKLSR